MEESATAAAAAAETETEPLRKRRDRRARWEMRRVVEIRNPVTIPFGAVQSSRASPVESSQPASLDREKWIPKHDGDWV